jgi:hypothetical protein
MLLEDGSIVVNLVTPLKTNFVNGTITSNDPSEFDWMGPLRYVKKSKAGATWYPNEIDTTVFLRGSRYRPSQPPLPINKNGIVTVLLSSGDLEEPLAIEGVLDPSGLIVSLTDYRLDYAVINPLTGVVRGFFIHPKTEAMTSFSGVVHQEYGQVHGAFLGPKHGGEVVIVPGRVSPEGQDR